MAHYPRVCEALALGSLLTELLCPLLLLGGGWLLLGGVLVALQVGIHLALGVAFRPMTPVFSALVPWSALYAVARRLKLGEQKVS
jgi:hypothetical protein